MTTTFEHVHAPLLRVVGDDTHVPLVTGEQVRYANLDYAASAPCLRHVADVVQQVLPLYASVHRGAGYLSGLCTDLYERARATVAAFVGAGPDDVTVLTRNTTDALNLLASCVPEGRGDVLTLDLEHHANLLPWRRGEHRHVPAGRTVAATVDALGAALRRRRTALLAVTGASNVTGETLPLAEIVAVAHDAGARVVVDAAQLAPHRRVDVAATGVDYLALSGHKLYAPFGSGVLVGRRDWLDAAPPYLAGGGAVREVTAGGARWAAAPARHEAGTPNLVGAVALAAACEALADLPDGALQQHDRRLRDRLVSGLGVLPGVRVLRFFADHADHADPVGVVAFDVDGVPAGKVAAYLSAEHGIGVRDGRFCAHPALQRLAAGEGAVRASIGVGTTAADVDRLVAGLTRLVTVGERSRYAEVDGRWSPVADPRPASSAHGLLSVLGADVSGAVGGSPCGTAA